MYNDPTGHEAHCDGYGVCTEPAPRHEESSGLVGHCDGYGVCTEPVQHSPRKEWLNFEWEEPIGPTEVDEELLTQGINTNGISGQGFYDWYINLYLQFDGWWWDFFGGTFSIYDAMTMVLIGEASYQYGKVSPVDFAEAAYRGLTQSCIKTNGGPCSIEQLINAFSISMQSARTRVQKMSHDPDPFSYRNFTKIEWGWSLVVSFALENPDPDWKHGWDPNRPFWFGDRRLPYVKRAISMQADYPDGVFYLNDGFLIPSGALWSAAHQ
jgi:hypothetical protein